MNPSLSLKETETLAKQNRLLWTCTPPQMDQLGTVIPTGMWVILASTLGLESFVIQGKRLSLQCEWNQRLSLLLSFSLSQLSFTPEKQPKSWKRLCVLLSLSFLFKSGNCPSITWVGLFLSRLETCRILRICRFHFGPETVDTFSDEFPLSKPDTSTETISVGLSLQQSETSSTLNNCELFFSWWRFSPNTFAELIPPSKTDNSMPITLLERSLQRLGVFSIFRIC